MYSKANSKGQKGKVGIEARGNGIRFNLPRSWFPDMKDQVRFALGLPNTPENWAIAESIAKEIERDFVFKSLPQTVEGIKRKYLPQSHLSVVETIEVKKLKLVELWDRYQEYKKPERKETTLFTVRGYEKHVKNLLTDLDCLDALTVRERLQKGTTNHQAKRCLIEINAAIKWGIKHGLVDVAISPYQGMAGELPRYNYEDNPAPNAFSEEEREEVLEAFKSHKGNWNGRGYTGFKYSHYASFVEFLFLSGCRPSEAVGLQWKHINSDYSEISFDGSISSLGKRNRIAGSKNNKTRKFPCSSRLREMLSSIRPENPDPDSLVFPAPKGGSINYNNFGNVAWNKIVDPLKSGTTPYSCRDTFITLQIMKGVPETAIAKWTDTSIEMIQKYYADVIKMKALRPLD